MSPRCVKCNAEINWVSTGSGQRLPLDMKPSPDGLIVVMPDGRARVLSTDERATTELALFTSHFATCRKSPKLGGPPS